MFVYSNSFKYLLVIVLNILKYCYLTINLLLFFNKFCETQTICIYYQNSSVPVLNMSLFLYEVNICAVIVCCCQGELLSSKSYILQCNLCSEFICIHSREQCVCI